MFSLPSELALHPKPSFSVIFGLCLAVTSRYFVDVFTEQTLHNINPQWRKCVTPSTHAAYCETFSVFSCHVSAWSHVMSGLQSKQTQSRICLAYFTVHSKVYHQMYVSAEQLNGRYLKRYMQFFLSWLVLIVGTNWGVNYDSSNPFLHGRWLLFRFTRIYISVALTTTGAG